MVSPSVHWFWPVALTVVLGKSPSDSKSQGNCFPGPGNLFVHFETGSCSVAETALDFVIPWPWQLKCWDCSLVRPCLGPDGFCCRPEHLLQRSTIGGGVCDMCLQLSTVIAPGNAASMNFSLVSQLLRQVPEFSLAGQITTHLVSNALIHMFLTILKCDFFACVCV